MEIKSQLEAALKEAMRARDELRKNTLRMVLSSIRQVEIDKGIDLDDQGVIAILHKEVKSRREAITDAERAGRMDLIQSSEDEIKIVENFLPKGLSPEELETLARQAVSEVGATSIREMGGVMKLLIPRLQGKATGDQASQVVRKILQG